MSRLTKVCDESIRQYLFYNCDVAAHKLVETRVHIRRTLVIGPGVRKKVLRRGDAVSFPYSM
jgi:hypothetical protein